MLFQFCYTSKALSDPQSLLSDLRDILNEAHHFNYLNHIYGVLYFADGYFFQCLEGDQTTIMQLFEKLKKIGGMNKFMHFLHEMWSRGYSKIGL